MALTSKNSTKFVFTYKQKFPDLLDRVIAMCIYACGSINVCSTQYVYVLGFYTPYTTGLKALFDQSD